MSECHLLRFLYLAYFAKPAAHRGLYRRLRKWRCRSVVEIGLGDGIRSRRLLEVASRYCSQTPLRYTGVDLFEARPSDRPGLPLKLAYQRLHLPGVRLQLVPGDPFQALSRVANTLTNTDLLIVSSGLEQAGVERAWFYVPRMLHEGSHVLVEQLDGSWNEVSRSQIESLAATQTRSVRKAA